MRHIAGVCLRYSRRERARTRAKVVAVPGDVEVDQLEVRKLILEAVERGCPIAGRAADPACARGLAVLNKPLRAVVNAVRIFRRDKLRARRDLVAQHFVRRVSPLGRRRDHGHRLNCIGKGCFICIKALLNPALRDELLDERVGRVCDLSPRRIRRQVGDRGTDAALELREEGARVIIDFAVRSHLKPEPAEEIGLPAHVTICLTRASALRMPRTTGDEEDSRNVRPALRVAPS